MMPADVATHADLMMTLTEPSEPDNRMTNANAMLMGTIDVTAMMNAADTPMGWKDVTALVQVTSGGLTSLPNARLSLTLLDVLLTRLIRDVLNGAWSLSRV